MTTPADASATCICGHELPHHATVDLLYGPRSPHCEWRGCGCPRFHRPALACACHNLYACAEAAGCSADCNHPTSCGAGEP